MAEDCIFCKIAAGEIPCDKVYETDQVLAFRDINPKAPVHVLVIPKEHVPAVSDLTEEQAELAGRLQLAVGEVARRLGLTVNGFRLVANEGAHGGQTVFHLHYHVLGGRALAWPPG